MPPTVFKIKETFSHKRFRKYAAAALWEAILRYEGMLAKRRNINSIQLFFIFHFYHQKWAKGTWINGNFNLLKVSTMKGLPFQSCIMFLQNMLNMISLRILIIECIYYIEIYNISICSFVVNKIVKVKNFRCLKKFQFVDVL